MCVHLCVLAHLCVVCVSVKIKAQLGRFDSFFKHGDPTQVVNLGSSCLHPMSHLDGRR